MGGTIRLRSFLRWRGSRWGRHRQRIRQCVVTTEPVKRPGYNQRPTWRLRSPDRGEPRERSSYSTAPNSGQSCLIVVSAPSSKLTFMTV